MRSRLLAAGGALLLAATLAACSTVTASGTAAKPATSTQTVVTTSSSLWDASIVHDISLTIDPTALSTMLAAYLADGTKDWISASVTIDGTTFTNVGIKLKGNSTLRGVSASSDPATLPWLVRLDKFVDGQSYDGETELVVRGNTSETALNEAVALDLLGQAGLATQEAISSKFTVNGGTSSLRLVIQNPDEEWDAQEFGDDGILYKADASGDYSYRGDDAASYTDVFDQETGDDNFVPLTTFLKFINQSDDATFASDLSKYLDVDSFATYLAFQDLIDNFDDIAGPGNNSYLRYDTATGKMTVVSWDLNLAFGQQNGGGGAGGAGGGVGGGQRPGGGAAQGGAAQGGAAQGGAAPGGGGNSQSNILVTRFKADPTFLALYNQAVTDLTAKLFTTGTAQTDLNTWTSLLTTQASDLVPTSTISAESAAIAAKFPS